MKIKIIFKHNDSPQWPCIAGTYIPYGNGEEYVCQVAKTWDEAEKLICDLVRARAAAGEVPPQKEVEV